MVDPRGIEPLLDGCKPTVLPLSLQTRFGGGFLTAPPVGYDPTRGAHKCYKEYHIM